MKKILLGILILLVIFTIYFYNQINSQNPNQFGDKEFEIKKGEGVRLITDNLVAQGFLEKPFWFKVYVAASGNKTKFVDGVYDLKTSMSIKELIVALTNAQNSNKEINITLLEGWTGEQMDDYLAKQNLIQPGDFLDYGNKYSEKTFLFLIDRPKKASLEGYLYPDTYRIYEQTSVAVIVDKMLANFDNKLTDEFRKEAKKQGRSIFEVVTLASIVEREMFGYENRRKVADIFLKRLKIGMALQSDATVNYVTQKGQAAPSSEDIKVDNPYNTYKYPGLPPGPISNPSIESIKAVLYPEDTEYWYFLNTPDGDIIFSENYDEHVLNKQKYLK